MKRISEARKKRKKLRRKKKNALVICQNGSRFWTTQDQFWQWVRERVLVKTGHAPLTGKLVRRNQEVDVVVGNVILNLGCPNHLREVVDSRRFRS